VASNNVDIVLRGKNEASSAIKQVKADLGGLDSTAKSLSGGLSGIGGMIGVAGIATAAMQVGRVVTELGNLGQQVQQQRAYFNVWSGGVGNATENLMAMRAAIGNVMTDSEAMAGANKLLSMGLATNSKELADLSKMAVMLGGSTRSASESIDEFSLLLANQSVLRLDTFGISGAKVRARIEELMAADANLSREQAFLNAVMEEGTAKVNALEAAGVKATTSAQDLATAWRGLREAIGEGIAPALTASQAGIAGFMAGLTASIQAGSDDAQIAISGMRSQLQLAQAELAGIEAQPLDPNDEFGTVAARSAILRDKIAELETRIAALTPQVVGLGVAGAGAANAVLTALNVASQASAVNPFYVPSELDQAEPFMWSADMGWVEEFKLASDKIAEQQNAAMMRANKAAADDYTRQMNAAFDKLAGSVQDKLGGAIQASIGLKDMTPDIFAPGSNGPFEAIFRAQSIAVHGTGGANEQQWAQMYGLTQESAKKIVTDFQAGLFTPDVIKLVDVNALTSQIQGEQAGAESTAAFAKMIANKLGVKDAGALVASKTFQAIAGGVDADPTQQTNAAKKVLDSYASNVQTIVSGKDYAGRMIGFGTTTWGYYEQGLLEGAGKSQVFIAAMNAAIAAYLAAHGIGATGGTGVIGNLNAGGSRP
jgi:hypothetical protein